ncbi:hypothetical protein [Alteromonas sp. 14N.309.X.WAT.G.H12]|uniref:hypothetical protein n=1 Tax=Alteromonas sp. 14N.309.X.WAT.G.H12 TaxID=3120824 RepID=UPI002FD74206
MSTSEALPGTGNAEYYSVEAICTTYELSDSDPLTASCSTEDTETNSVVTIESCDTATVTGQIPSTYYATQGEAIVLSRLCVQNNYETLDSYDILRSTTETDGIYDIEASCSGYVGTEIIDGCENSECIGDVVDEDSLYSKIELYGEFYRDLCSEETLLDCENCESGTFSFTDSVTGNTCEIDVEENYSGQESHYDFFDSATNGSVDVLCNDGSKSVLSSGDSTCYKTCTGNVTVGWEDSEGSQSCANTIPAGNYSHNEVVTLYTSITNTGTSTFKCDGYTGNWVQESGACLLDCTSEAVWGDGYSNSGEDKTDLCRADPGDIPNGTSGSITSTTANTSGSASYVCQNGELVVTPSSCEMDCSSQTVTWGAYCEATVTANNNGDTISVNHSASTSYAYDSSISGTATLQCVDGAYQQYSTPTCTYITGTDEGDWIGWTEESRSCSTSPDSDDYQPDESFTQTTTCTISYVNSRDVYYVWNDGSETKYDTEYDYKTDTEMTQASVSGTGEAVRDYIGSEWGDWGDWEEYNRICYNTTCTVYYEQYRYLYELYDMDPEREITSTSERNTKTETVAAPRTMTGEGWGDWGDWEQDGDADCTDSGNETVCVTTFISERCWESYYNLAPKTVVDCTISESQTKTETETTENEDASTSSGICGIYDGYGYEGWEYVNGECCGVPYGSTSMTCLAVP